MHVYILLYCWAKCGFLWKVEMDTTTTSYNVNAYISVRIGVCVRACGVCVCVHACICV